MAQHGFGGSAGETVRRFVAFSTLLTLLPALMVTGVLGGIGILLAGLLSLPMPLPFLFLLIFTSPVIGRYAIAAKEGELAAGFFSGLPTGALAQFVQRYAVLTLAWGLPVGLAGTQVIKNLAGSVFGLGDLSSAGALFSSMSLVGLLLVAILAPSLSLLVATKNASVAECFQRETWDWLMERRSDLPMFYAAFVGGVFLFIALVMPMMMLVVGAMFWLSPAVGIAAGAFTYTCPAVAAPVLMGRLAGAFVRSEREGSPLPGVSGAHFEPLPPAPQDHVPVLRGPPPLRSGVADLTRTLKALQGRPESDRDAVIQELERLKVTHPRHAGLLCELTKQYRRAGRVDAALALGAEAISVGLTTGATPLALSVYLDLGEQRAKLPLEHGVLDQLGRVLLTNNDFKAAANCFVASARAGGEAAKAHKGLIATADAAAKAGQMPVAASIYEHVLREAPTPATEEYCQNVLRTLKTRNDVKRAPSDR